MLDAPLSAPYKTRMAAVKSSDPISVKEEQVARLSRELEIAQAELRGMKMYRDQHVAVESSRTMRATHVTRNIKVGSSASNIGYRGGRQPGAISTAWRGILADAYHAFGDDGFLEDDLISLANHHGIRLKPSDARNRMLSYLPYSYVEENPDRRGNWRVTTLAAEKFGFAFKPSKDAAPDAEAPGPHKSDLQTDQTGAALSPEKGANIFE